ncbi:hypothetical protein [Thiolapillus sp.]
MAAVSVEVNDGAGKTLCSGDLVNMSTTTEKVTVGMNGNCGAGVGSLTGSTFNLGAVDEGSYTALTQTILNGVTLTPPVSAQITQPAHGSVSVSHQSDLTYKVSYSAQNAIVDADTSDPFSVTITDSSTPAPQTATLSFNVTVNDVAAPPPPPPGSGCVSTDTLICKGELDMTTNGEQYGVSIETNNTHVWTIMPDKRGSFENFVFDYLTNPMTVSLSTSYDADSTDEYCTKTVKSGNLYLNEYKTVFQCHVQPDTVYFLRITTQGYGRYSVFY